MAPQTDPIERNLGFELVRVTESAAMWAARWMGKGDKNAADQAAVDAMRRALQSVDMDGVVVIGEGEKDEAPMLFIGEEIGNGMPPRVDIAVDPIDGTRLLSRGLPNALSVVALAPRGTMFYPGHVAYMNKIVVGPDARGCIDIDARLTANLRSVARAKSRDIEDLTVVILDRDRHTEMIEEIREAGARIKMITDGDVAGAIMAAMEGTGADMLVGIGGAPEAVVAACAIRCLGGEMQCKLWPRTDAERERGEADGLDFDKVLTLNDLVTSEDVFFAATGITGGELLKGVTFTSTGAWTYSLVMRGKSGTIRHLESQHNFKRLDKIADRPYD